MSIHTTPSGGSKQAKPSVHKCTECDKSFQKPSQLERHFRIHTGNGKIKPNPLLSYIKEEFKLLEFI